MHAAWASGHRTCGRFRPVERRSPKSYASLGVIEGWREHFAAYGVTNSDLGSLAARIDGDPLQGQRRAFTPADYATSRTPKRRSPFAR